MPLIVETGLGLADADSYCSVDFADSYFEKYGNAAWDSVEDKEAALRKATSFMLQNYRLRWKGYRRQWGQALDWPRVDVFLQDFGLSSAQTIPIDVIPNEVRVACAILAYESTVSELNPNLDQQVVSEKVGPLMVTYSEHSPQHRRFKAVDMLLRHLLVANGLCRPVARS